MKMTITRKIALGFGLGIVALVLLSALAFIGSGKILTRATEVSQARQIDYMLSQAETDHLLWDAKVRQALIDPEAKEAGVQVDPHKCNLGRNYSAHSLTAMESEAKAVSPR
ncbi:MAG: CZB domain-containing protein [Candidatus Sedimenticola endophacoides]